MEFIRSMIYVYFYLVLGFLFFNIGFVIKEKFMRVVNRRKKQVYQKVILEEMRYAKKGKRLSSKHERFLLKELRKAKNLMLFEEVLLELRKSNPSFIERYGRHISSVFEVLTVYYKERSSLQKAYFTHVLSVFPEFMQRDDRAIFYAMMHFVFDKSIYCRENAMLFFYRRGSSEQVANALKKISRRNLYYSPKLLADDLLQFQGDFSKLTSLLLADFNDYSVNFQVAIINFLRLCKVDWKEEIYQKLSKGHYDKETELAMIRYFATHEYEPALEKLLTFMKSTDIYSYEYQIVTAASLASYDVSRVREVLIHSLTDSNYYVRKNAAISLAKMTLTKEDLKTISALDDLYAQEMLQYIWQEAGRNFEAEKLGRMK